MTGRANAAVIVALFTLSACAAAADMTVPRTEKEPEPPPGAVEIEKDILFAVPVDVAFGCTRYRLWSPTRMVPQALYYLDRDGKPVLDRARCAR